VAIAATPSPSPATGPNGRGLLSTPVAPTFREIKPFGEHVEGLSHCGNETYAIEAAVQTDDFEDSPLGGVISRNPLILQGLREFKHLRREFGRFVV